MKLFKDTDDTKESRAYILEGMVARIWNDCRGFQIFELKDTQTFKENKSFEELKELAKKTIITYDKKKSVKREIENQKEHIRKLKKAIMESEDTIKTLKGML